MKKILFTLLITALSFSTSFGQGKLKSIWNKTFKKSDTTVVKQKDADEEGLTESNTNDPKKESKIKSIWNNTFKKSNGSEKQDSEVKTKKVAKEKKPKKNIQTEQVEQQTQTKPVDQNSYSWEEDQKLYYYLINEKKDYAKATQIGKLMVKKTEEADEKQPYQIGQSHSNLGMAYYYSDNFLAAHHHLTKASEISEEVYGGSSMALANDFKNLANNYIGLGYKETAITYLKTAIDIKIGYLGGNSDQVIELKNQYNSLLKADNVVKKEKPKQVYTKPVSKQQASPANYVMDNKTKQEIIDALYKKVRADYPLIQGKNDTTVIVQELSAKEKNNIKKEILKELKHENTVKEIKKEKKQAHVSKTKESSETKKPVYVKIKEGDSLWRLSFKYGTTVEAVKKLNNLESNNLKVGSRIRVK